MKVVKAIVALLLSAAVFLSAIWISAASSVYAVLRRDAMEHLLDETDLSDAIYSAAGNITEGMDALTGRLIETPSVRRYLDEAAGTYVIYLLYGEPSLSVRGSDLEPILSGALSDLESEGSLSSLEKLEIEGLRYILPQVSEGLAAQIRSYIPSRTLILAQVGLTPQTLEDILFLIGPSVRNILTAFAVILALIIFLLYRKRGSFLYWLGTLAILPGIGCVVLGILLNGAIRDPFAAYGLAGISAAFLRAFLIRGSILMILGAVLLILGAVIGASAGRRNDLSDPSSQSPRHAAK